MPSSFPWSRQQARRFFPGLSLYYAAENIWRVVLLWQVLTLTHSPWWMAVSVAADMLPVLLVGIWGPHRGGGRTLSGLAAWQAGAMLGGAVFGGHNAIVLVVLAAFNGWWSARVVPSAQALLMRSTPPGDLSRASARYELASRIGILVGPALGGLSLTAMPVGVILGGLAVLFIAAQGLWRSMSDETLIAPAGMNGGGFKEFGQTLKIVTRDPFLGMALSVRGLTNLLWPAFTLAVPLLSLDVWHVGSAGYGVLRSVWGLSTVIATLWIVPLFVRRLQNAYFISWMISGIGFFAIALSPTYAWALAADAVGAVGGPLVHVALDTHIGRHVDPVLQGRVFAFQQFIMSTLAMAGLGLISVSLKNFPPTAVLAAAGSLMIVASSLGLWMWRRSTIAGKSHCA